MTNNFDPNKLNSLIEMANNIISCDSNCQKNKQLQELKNKLTSAESNLLLAEPNLELAKKNYFTYISGKSGYNEMVEEELSKNADLFITTFKDNYQEELSKITSQLDTYNGLYINFSNVDELYKKYKKENAILFEQLKEETNDILTNDRKTYYENQQIDLLNAIYFYLLWIIYFIVVACFGVFSLIYPSTFNWKTRLFILLFFVVLPFISPFLLGKIISIIYWLFGFLPKNVYK
jgi:hypothetical protein